MEKSCGILVYRKNNGTLQVLLGQCGGLYRSNGWNIPKGHIEDGESELECAKREFSEETSLEIPSAEFIDLGTSKTSKGKIVKIFAMEHDYNENGCDVDIVSNICKKEYPPNSGNIMEFPELKNARYMDVDEALDCIFPYQKIFIENIIEATKEMA